MLLLTYLSSCKGNSHQATDSGGNTLGEQSFDSSGGRPQKWIWGCCEGLWWFMTPVKTWQHCPIRRDEHPQAEVWRWPSLGGVTEDNWQDKKNLIWLKIQLVAAGSGWSPPLSYWHHHHIPKTSPLSEAAKHPQMGNWVIKHQHSSLSLATSQHYFPPQLPAWLLSGKCTLREIGCTGKRSQWNQGQNQRWDIIPGGRRGKNHQWDETRLKKKGNSFGSAMQLLPDNCLPAQICNVPT